MPRGGITRTSWTPGNGPKTIGPGRPAIPKDVKLAAKAHTSDALETLANVCSSSKYSPAARVAAATALLDRGWGKPSQEITGADGAPLMVPAVQIFIGAIPKDEDETIEHGPLVAALTNGNGHASD